MQIGPTTFEQGRISHLLERKDPLTIANAGWTAWLEKMSWGCLEPNHVAFWCLLNENMIWKQRFQDELIQNVVVEGRAAFIGLGTRIVSSCLCLLCMEDRTEILKVSDKCSWEKEEIYKTLKYLVVLLATHYYKCFTCMTSFKPCSHLL